MFFACRMHKWLLRGLVVAGLAVVLASGCGEGGGSQEEEQASEADLDAALEQSFQESAAPGVVAAVQTPEYTWVRALGWRTAPLRSR